MAKTLNFNTVNKKYLPVVFADEKNTTILVSTPTKAIMDSLISIQASLETLTEDETNREATEILYTSCAKILSRNKTGHIITTEFLGEVFDFEDIIIFFNAYMDFIDEIANSKN